MNKTQETKNCHYVQQAYLRNFASNTNRTRIWQFDKKKDEVKERQIKKVAKQDYFYEQAVENWLKDNVEVRGIKAIRKLIRFKDLDILTTNERKNIVLWVIVQNERTLLRRIDLENSSRLFMEKLSKFENIPKIPENYTINGEQMQYEIMNKMIDLVPFLLNYHWVLLENNTDIDFYTSDQVITMGNSFRRSIKKKIGFNPFIGGLGYLVDGIELHIPLNPHLLLLMINTQIKYIPKMQNNKIRWEKVTPVMQKFHEEILRYQLPRSLARTVLFRIGIATRLSISLLGTRTPLHARSPA